MVRGRRRVCTLARAHAATSLQRVGGVCAPTATARHELRDSAGNEYVPPRERLLLEALYSILYRCTHSVQRYLLAFVTWQRQCSAVAVFLCCLPVGTQHRVYCSHYSVTVAVQLAVHAVPRWCRVQWTERVDKCSNLSTSTLNLARHAQQQLVVQRESACWEAYFEGQKHGRRRGSPCAHDNQATAAGTRSAALAVVL